jgi:two-component system, OmpR family, sensor histidine kinase MprB
MTLRRKFAIAFAAIAATVAILVGLLSYTITAHNVHNEIDRSLETAAATLAAGGNLTAGGGAPTGTVDGPGTGDRDRGIIQGAQAIATDGTVTELLGANLAIPVDDADRALASTGIPVTRVFSAVTIDGATYRVLTQSLGGGKGAVQVARDEGEATRVLGGLALTTVLAGLAVVIAAAAAGWLIARRITSRLVALTEVAETVSATGQLDVNFPAPGRDEVGRLSASLHTMLGQLAKLRDDQQRLVQNAGHELRTPLTSLRTNAQVLRRFAELAPDSQRRLLDDVDGETRELTHLVNELVDLATDQRDDEEPELVDLALLADRVADRFRRRSGRYIPVQAQPCTAQARPHDIERALSNLIDNALKFDPTGTEPIEVHVHAGIVEVLDRGPGVDIADSGRIFERFYRATTARSMPGSGLGLAIVNDVAARHGGTVSAATRPGGGAVIGFTIGIDRLLPESKPQPISSL